MRKRAALIRDAAGQKPMNECRWECPLLGGDIGEYDLTHKTARAMIECLNRVTGAHASALAPRKGNQGFKVVTIGRASSVHIGTAGFVWIKEEKDAGRAMFPCGE